MLREEATVLTGMLIGLSAIDFRLGLGGGGRGGSLAKNVHTPIRSYPPQPCGSPPAPTAASA